MKTMSLVAAALMCAAASAESKPDMVRIGGEGKVAFVNACDAPTGELKKSLDKFVSVYSIDYEIKKGAWSLADAQSCFDAAKANAAIFIVRDKTLPISLIAMESKWGVVNAEGLDEKCIAKEALRVATVVLGGASSRYKASVLRPVFSKDDLKENAGEYITFDSIVTISNYAPSMGIKPYQMMTREDAIEDGLIKK